MKSRLECAGCGWTPGVGAPLAFTCGARDEAPLADHVLAVRLDHAALAFPTSAEPCPFIRYRTLMRAYHVAIEQGWSDARYVELVGRVDEQVARVDGHGFRVTPLFESAPLAERAGIAEGGRALWIKDETCQVAGSHKARHLMGIAIALAVLEGDAPPSERRLAIASCGNAALAAAVVARAVDRPLDVFIPTWADERVVQRLTELGARLVRCPREPGGPPGDPCYHRFREAVAAGSLPFTCQGSENGLTIDGGKTLAWEIAEGLRAAGRAVDTLLVQVGGGALASSLCQGLADAVALGVTMALPRVCPVQSEGGHPFERAWHRLARGAAGRAPAAEGPRADTDEALAAWLLASDRERRPWLAAELDHARAHRAEYMWPLEHEPKSVASGILDDETYDWLAIARAMVASGGVPVIATDDQILRARDDARAATGVLVDATGAAGLAGLYAGAPRGRESLALLTGRQR